MAGRWEGFSDDYIKQYLDSSVPPTENDVPLACRKVSNLGKTHRARKEKYLGSTKPEGRAPEYDISEEALLIKRPVSQVNANDNSPCQYLSNGRTSSTTTSTSDDNREHVTNDSTSSANDSNVALSEENLEQFHARQKLLEERNRQRKEFLVKLLSDRKKQTTQEAQRLQKIQEELHKLDVLLSDDVRILRDEIETAAKDFGEAQKRFGKAEKEFLDAKQCLFTKMERKELLTRHLCTIIEQNEMRKAQKLSELMEKLSTACQQPSEPEIKAEPEPTATVQPEMAISNSGIKSTESGDNSETLYAQRSQIEENAPETKI